MKRFVGLGVMVIMLLQFAAVGICETSDTVESIEFEPKFTGIFEYSASEWYESEYNRSLLTVMLASDVMFSLTETDPEAVPDFLKSSYVGKAGLDLVVAMPVDDEYWIVMYRPLTDEALYMTFDYDMDILIELALDEVCTDGYEKNDPEKIFEMVDLLAGILSE